MARIVVSQDKSVKWEWWESRMRAQHNDRRCCCKVWWQWPQRSAWSTQFCTSVGWCAGWNSCHSSSLRGGERLSKVALILSCTCMLSACEVLWLCPSGELIPAALRCAPIGFYPWRRWSFVFLKLDDTVGYGCLETSHTTCLCALENWKKTRHPSGWCTSSFLDRRRRSVCMSP